MIDSGPRINFECGHEDVGTNGTHAGYHPSCAECQQYYCDACNFGHHVCNDCGEEYNHGSYTVEHPDCARVIKSELLHQQIADLLTGRIFNDLTGERNNHSESSEETPTKTEV